MPADASITVHTMKCTIPKQGIAMQCLGSLGSHPSFPTKKTPLEFELLLLSMLYPIFTHTNISVICTWQPVDPLMGNDDALLAGLQELEALDMEDQLLATPVVALRAVPSGKLQQLLATRAVALPAVPSGNLPEVKNATAVIPVSPVPVSACELFPLTGNAPVTMNCQPESAKVKVKDQEKQEKRRKQNVERV